MKSCQKNLVSVRQKNFGNFQKILKVSKTYKRCAAEETCCLPSWGYTALKLFARLLKICKKVCVCWPKEEEETSPPLM